MVTRRVTRRHFLLRPDRDKTLQNLYWYCTAVIAMELGVVVHAAQLLSDHMHEVLTDTRGNLPRFFELRNRLFANAIKCHRGWSEEVFSRTQANWVELTTPRAVIAKIAYVIANCVAAFLVRTPRKWPGVTVLVDDIGRRVVRVERPKMYFDANNPKWPAVVELAVEMPEQVREHCGGDDEARAAIQEELDEQIQEAHAEAKRKGRPFLGAARVLKTSFKARADSWEEFGSRWPTFAAAGDVEAAASAVARLRAFRATYRECWLLVKNGERDVVFPYGTWKMAYSYGVRCEPPPS